MGAWIATNSIIAIRTEAPECSSPCLRGLLGSPSSPLRAHFLLDATGWLCTLHPSLSL
jgi:hypothetical protein